MPSVRSATAPRPRGRIRVRDVLPLEIPIFQPAWPFISMMCTESDRLSMIVNVATSTIEERRCISHLTRTPFTSTAHEQVLQARAVRTFFPTSSALLLLRQYFATSTTSLPSADSENAKKEQKNICERSQERSGRVSGERKDERVGGRVEHGRARTWNGSGMEVAPLPVGPWAWLLVRAETGGQGVA